MAAAVASVPLWVAGRELDSNTGLASKEVASERAYPCLPATWRSTIDVPRASCNKATKVK
jgi:hypothetical protein